MRDLYQMIHRTGLSEIFGALGHDRSVKKTYRQALLAIQANYAKKFL